jgi:hypothetical protein
MRTGGAIQNWGWVFPGSKYVHGAMPAPQVGTAGVDLVMPCAGPLSFSADGRSPSRPPVCQLSARSEAASPGRPGRC